MKKNYWPSSLLKTSIAVAFLLLTSSISGYCQLPTWSPPFTTNLSDIVMQQPIDNQTVNVDMFSVWDPMSTSTIPDNQFWAIVCDDITLGESYLMLVDRGMNQGADIVIPDAIHPDVAILDDWTNPGEDFWVAVVYENIITQRAEVAFYKFTGINVASSLNYNSPIVRQLSSGAPSLICTYPHIDAAPDPNYSINSIFSSPPGGIYGMYQYVIAWHENNSGISTDEINAVSDNLMTNVNNIPSQAFVNSNINYIEDGVLSDVALQYKYLNNTSVTSGDYIAYFIVYDGSDILQANWNITSSTVNNGLLAIESGTVSVPPRIEAANAMVNGSNITEWEAVAEIIISTDKEVHSYNVTNGAPVSTINYSASGYMSPAANPMNGIDLYSPAVATAANNTSWAAGTANAGNNEYTIGWHVDSDEYYAISQDGTNIANVIAGYDLVNTAACTTAITTGNNKPSIAFSYASNDGYGFAVAWFDGLNINIKDCGNTAPYYKPTEVKKLALPTNISVFPNPATDYIRLSSRTANGNFTILDMIGRPVIQGKISGPLTQVDISLLPQGAYVFSLKEEGNIRNLRFTKQ